MARNLDYKKWGILVAIIFPIGALGMIFLPSPYRGWVVPVFLVLFWASYYSWVGLDKRKKNLAKTN